MILGYNNNAMDGYIRNLVIGFIYLVFGIIFVSKISKRSNKKEINIYFSLVISFLYLGCVFASATRFTYYNLPMLTPLSNVSPLLFFLTLVSLFLNDRFKERIYKLFCIFNAVMVIAGFISNISCIVLGSNYFKFVIFDELAHITFGLFTFYLIKSGQVSITKKDYLVDSVIISVILIISFVLNYKFNTSFFGLCLNDNFSIYGVKFFDNCHVSNIVYVICLFAIMFIGYLLYKLIKNKLKV